MLSPVVWRLAGSEREAEAHDPDAKEDGDQGADPEVDDRLVDRQVERAEMDGHPGRQLELVLRLEVLGRRQEQCEAHRFGVPEK